MCIMLYRRTNEIGGNLEFFLREGYNQTELVTKLIDLINGKESLGLDSWEAEGDQGKLTLTIFSL